MSNRRYIESQRRPRPRKVWRGLLGCALGLGLSSTAKADDPTLDLSWLTLDPLTAPTTATVVRPGIALPLTGSTSDLKGDSDNVLTQNDTTGTLTIHSLTFDSSKNPVTLTQLPGTVLTINGVSPTSFDAITKGGTFDSVITGGILATTQNAFTIEVDAGLLRIDSALSGEGKQLVLSGAGTLELTNTSSSNNFSGGIILNSGTLRISNDLNLGARSQANVIDFRGGALEIADKADVTLDATRFINVNRGGGTITTTGIGTLSLLGDDQLRGGTLAGLVKTGTGTLVLGGKNSFAGPLTVLQGTLELQNPSALGLDTHSALNLANSTLNFHSDATALNFGNDITLGDDSSIDFGRIKSAEPGTFLVNRLIIPSLKTAPTLNFTNSSADGSVFRFEGAVQLGTSVSLNVAKGAVAALDGPIVGGSTGIIKSGTGTLIISGATDNRFSSPVLVTGGLLSLSKAKGFVAVPSDLLISGGQVRLDASDQISDASNITLSLGSFRLNGQSDSATSMTINGGAFTTGIGGRLFLTLPAGAAVPASFPGGTVSVNAVPALIITGGTTTINSGGEINATTVQVSGGVNTVQENGLFTIGSGGLTMAGISSPNINFTSSATSPGRLSLSGNVSYTGTSGMASIASTGALALNGVMDLNGAQRDFSINDDGTSAVDMLISTDITNGALKKSGLGTLRLTGNNTYTGGTTISAGLLEISGASALGTGPLTFNSGQIDVHSDASVTTLTNLLNSTSADVVLDVDRDTPLGPTKGSVNFTGGLSIAANQLMVTGANRTVSFTAPTTLLGTAKINAASTAVDVEFSAPIVQSGGTWGVTKDGIGKVIFDGGSANTYTGATRVQNGTLELSKPTGVTSVPGALNIFAGTVRLTAANQIADASAVSVNGASSTLDLNGNNETIASLGGTGGNVTLGGATLIITQGSYPGAIGGAGMVVQENPLGGTSAILTLGGANTFTGGVTVNHGVVNFSQQAPGHTGTTLASGVWHVFNGSSLNFNAGSNITANTFTGGVTVNHGVVNFSQQAPGHTGTTLAAGVWHVFNGSSLNFNAGSNITANNTEVILDGAASNFAKFDTLASNAGMFTISGGKTFAAKGALANSGNLTVGAGSALTVNGGFTNTGTANIGGSLVAAGVIDTSGTLTISGPQTYAPATAMNVKGGMTSLNSNAGAPGNYKLSINATGGLLQFGSTQHLAGLTLTSSAGLGAPLAAPLPDGPLPPPAPAAGSLVLTTQSLSTSGAGTLDLQNNALVVDYTGSTPFDSVKAAILLGYNSSGTPWAGHGITSSTAAASPTSYGVGYAEASGIFGAGGGTFDGQSVDGTAVLARFTKLGDATLDGAVDFNDLVKLAQNYNTSGTSWNSGDFTYDGTTDFNDLVKLAQNYNTALAAVAIPGAPAVFEADLARALAQVPEPSALHLILAATIGLAGKRRRRGGAIDRGVPA